MLRIEHERWGQTIDDLRELATKAPHARTRERFLAFYEIAGGELNATTWALATGKHWQTVMSWVHRYNDGGPEAAAYRHTGGWPPPFSP